MPKILCFVVTELLGGGGKVHGAPQLPHYPSVSPTPRLWHCVTLCPCTLIPVNLVSVAG